MGLFTKTKVAPKESQSEISLKMAQNVFKDTLLEDEIINNAISGKSDSENLIFSVGVLAITDKRLLYYFQSGSQTGVETIMFSKIVSVTSISGVEKKMGPYAGIAIEIINGKKRIVRCIPNQENKLLISKIVFEIESLR